MSTIWSVCLGREICWRCITAYKVTGSNYSRLSLLRPYSDLQWTLSVTGVTVIWCIAVESQFYGHLMHYGSTSVYWSYFALQWSVNFTAGWCTTVEPQIYGHVILHSETSVLRSVDVNLFTPKNFVVSHCITVESQFYRKMGIYSEILSLRSIYSWGQCV